MLLKSIAIINLTRLLHCWTIFTAYGIKQCPIFSENGQKPRTEISTDFNISKLFQSQYYYLFKGGYVSDLGLFVSLWPTHCNSNANGGFWVHFQEIFALEQDRNFSDFGSDLTHRLYPKNSFILWGKGLATIFTCPQEILPVCVVGTPGAF